MKYLKEFKKFAIQGNVIDLAVAVIIGGAFGKIVTSLVNDIIMPPIGLLLGGVKFSDIKIVLQQAIFSQGTWQPALTLNIGNFIQNIFDFLIIALVIFFMIKLITHLKKQNEVASDNSENQIISPTDKLLMEIRDNLKK